MPMCMAHASMQQTPLPAGMNNMNANHFFPNLIFTSPDDCLFCLRLTYVQQGASGITNANSLPIYASHNLFLIKHTERALETY